MAAHSCRRIALGAALVLIATVIAPRFAAACGPWDSDTLAEELEGFRELADVITGRFPRNPHRYYELRLERAAERIAANPDDLAAYNDAGAACDGLGRGDEAIAWMERKREALGRVTLSAEERAEHDYRLLATIGTFRAHHWMRSNVPGDVTELRRGRDEVAAAIELEPNGDVGRERDQLAAMEWLLESPTYDGGPFGTFIEIAREDRAGRERAIAGLAEMITAGPGWESVDVFHQLANVLALDHRSSVAFLAYERVRELALSGKPLLAANGSEHWKLESIMRWPHAMPDDLVDDYWIAARNHAESWHRHRTRYMADRFDLNEHPDWTPSFWDRYEEVPRPIDACVPGGSLELPPIGVLDLLITALIVIIATRRQWAQEPLPAMISVENGRSPSGGNDTIAPCSSHRPPHRPHRPPPH